ncbi:MAG: glycosyltransferase family 2 protein [Oscillospiraceae bacterium]
MQNKDCLYLVVPCYNEEDVLPKTATLLLEKIKNLIDSDSIAHTSRIMFVDDGSKDATWKIIQHLCLQSPHIVGIKLSRNKGHQNALLAGLLTAKESADILISLDADLQDDIDAIGDFIGEYKKGFEIVYGVRSKRDTDTFFKKMSAQGFYTIMNQFGVEIVCNHADYRLMSKRVVECLENFSEVNLFLRGIVPLLGFRTTQVFYERGKRFAGESKYPLKKMVSFALDGITSFSIKPIRMILWIGAIIFLMSLFILFASLFQKVFGYTVRGWTTLIVSIWMIGGIQLLCIGIIGEYIGKIYSETKSRPRYFIEDRCN